MSIETTAALNTLDCEINFNSLAIIIVVPLTMNNIKEGSHVLYIWDGELNADIEANVNEIKNIKNIQLKVENLQRISLGER